jgi:hypothetical protein
MGGGASSSHWLERMQVWAFIPLCGSILQVLQYSIHLFPNTPAFVVVPTKRQNFSFFRNHFLPVMNPKSHTSLVIQVFHGVEREHNGGRSGEAWFCPRSHFSPLLNGCAHLHFFLGQGIVCGLIYVHSKSVNVTLGILFLWLLVTASVNEWKLLRLIERKGIVWRKVS